MTGPQRRLRARAPRGLAAGALAALALGAGLWPRCFPVDNTQKGPPKKKLDVQSKPLRKMGFGGAGPGSSKRAQAAEVVEPGLALNTPWTEVDGGKHRDEMLRLSAMCKQIETLAGQGNLVEADARLPLLAEDTAAAIGTKTWVYADVNLLWARILSGLKRFDSALKKLDEARMIYISSGYEETPKYAIVLSCLGATFREKGNLDRAEELLVEARSLIRDTLNADHVEYARVTSNLANVHQKRGDLDKALPLQLEAKELIRDKLGASSMDYAQVLNNLGALYEEQGNFKEAEPIRLEALDISEKKLGKKHPQYASLLMGYAGTLASQGSYIKAAPLLEKAKGVYADSVGEKHPAYAMTLRNLAQVYNAMGLTDKAEQCLQEAQRAAR